MCKNMIFSPTLFMWLFCYVEKGRGTGAINSAKYAFVVPSDPCEKHVSLHLLAVRSKPAFAESQASMLKTFYWN